MEPPKLSITLRGQLLKEFTRAKSDLESRLKRSLTHVEFMGVLLRLYQLAAQQAAG